MSSFFSLFLSTIYADAPEEQPAEKADSEGVVEDNEEADLEVVGKAVAEEPKPEEEEEPEDVQPGIREECKASAKCASLTKHFEHCQEKVNSGQGFKGEDCVEELMMHCVDTDAAPKLFAKLR